MVVVLHVELQCQSINITGVTLATHHDVFMYVMGVVKQMVVEMVIAWMVVHQVPLKREARLLEAVAWWGCLCYQQQL